MREFPITLWHIRKASQQLVPRQWICKARTEGIIWFSIYSSGQFLQQSILINKLKPYKKNQTEFESFLLQQAGLWGLTVQHRHIRCCNLGKSVLPDLKHTLMLLSKCQNTRLIFSMKFWEEKYTHTNNLGLILPTCYFTLQQCRKDLNVSTEDMD